MDAILTLTFAVVIITYFSARPERLTMPDIPIPTPQEYTSPNDG